jgi:hypothetical protein
LNEIDTLEVRLEGIEFTVSDGHVRQLETEGTTESDMDRGTVERVVKENILDYNVTLDELGDTGIEIHTCIFC